MASQTSLEKLCRRLPVSWQAILPPCKRCMLEKDPVILFLGASITRGYGLRKNYAFPQRIQAFLDEAGAKYRVVNAAENGAATVHGLMQMNPFLQPGINLQYLVICLGLSDAAYRRTPEQIDKNLSQIVEMARLFNPEIKIFLFQHRVFQTFLEGKVDGFYKAHYAKVFEDVARREDLTLLPFFLEGVANDPELNRRDGVHPNYAGMSRVTQNVWQALRPHLLPEE